MIKCNRCDKDVDPVLSKSGPHTKADCPLCERYIKFLPKEDIIIKTNFKRPTLESIKKELYEKRE